MNKLKWKRSEYTICNRGKTPRTIYQYGAKSENDKWEQREFRIICDYHGKGTGSGLDVIHGDNRIQDVGDFKSLKIAKEIARMLDENMVNI